MRRALAVVVCMLAFPATAAGAVFTTPLYQGATYLTGAGPFRWGISSSYPLAEELGGVSVEVSPGGQLHRCLGPGTLILTGLEEGTTFSVRITDDYSPVWLTEHEETVSEACAGATPAGGNAMTDSVTISGSKPLPLPVNTPTPYEKPNAEALEHAGLGARLQQEKFEAERAAREAQERAAAQSQVPPAPKPSTCTVPELVGHTLAGARHVLTISHCRLGHVLLPAHHRGLLAVAHQHPHRGTKLPLGAAVSVTLAVERR